MDLGCGYDSYLAERRASGCSSLNRALSKGRKMEREIGPLRFALHDADRSAFDAVIRWKRQQIAETPCADMFRSQWVIDVLQAICDMQTDEFSGMVSTLYAGDSLIAAQIGMRNRNVISSWIPTLNLEFNKYSPGLLLHLEMAKAAAADGVQRIDLGRGQNQMKTSLRSGGIQLAMGAVDRRPLNRMFRHCWYKTRDLVHATPLNGLPLRFYRRMRSFSTPNS